MTKINRIKGINLLGLDSSETGVWKINPFTLRFTGELSQYEADFRNDYFDRSLNPFRFSMILAAVIYGIFAILDAILLPELKNVFWLIRFGMVTPALAAVVAFSYSPLFRRYMQSIITVIMYFTGLGIIVMLVYAANVANHYSYYAGLILIFIFGYTFIKARFIYACIAGWSIVLSYEISATLLTETPVEILINNNYFFISANIIGMFINYFMEHSLRKDYIMRRLLQMEQEKVQAANNALEKRVKERTRQLTIVNRDLKKEIEIRKKQEEEKAKIEAQLMQLQKMETIGTLAGGIAHDFNNILTPILGYTEMALEELSQESTLRYDIEQISNGAKRGKDLVQQILTFSRQVDFDKKPLHLNKIVNEIMNLIKASFPSNIEISQHLDADCGTVMADATQMHQIIMNLCTNSYHSMMKRGGKLEVSLRAVDIGETQSKKIGDIKPGTYVCLSVKDTGHGMDKQTMDRIFEPFFTRKEVGAGSGLGLSVVHGIVKNYNGAITVTSKPGKGAEFKIFLPQYSAEADSQKKVIKKSKKGHGHILFVDDEQEITFMGKRMLESLGYTVDIRTDGKSALNDFSKNPQKYDLLVTDQAMPQMPGTDLIKSIKAIRPDLKTIIITGYSDAIPPNSATELGVDEIILKPLILSEFSKLIGKVLSKKKVAD